jgi:two-component system sensor histidine kinase BarA
MNRTGIQFRLLLLGILPTLLLVISLAFYFIHTQYLDLENALIEKGKITINQLAISSIYGVFSGNTDVLNEIATALLDEPDIVLVHIFDGQGDSLVQLELAHISQKKGLVFFQHPVSIHSIKQKANKATNTPFKPPINIPSKKIGLVKIALSMENTQIRQQSYLINSLFLICFGIIFTTLLALRLSKRISSPIISLTTTANNLADGDMATRARRSSIPEIDDLCQSFNTMATGLQQTQHYLRQQVDLAVKEMTSALSRLEEKNKSLEKTTQLAIAQNKSKSQFIAHISHEIRTPMNGIVGFIELLSQSNLSLQQLDQAQLIKSSANSLLAIVNEILDYSSLETGNFKINISTFDLRGCIENCSTLVSPASNKVQIIINIDNNIPDFISTDPIRLQQIITNLLGNACKFTHHGHIIIRCHLLTPGSLFISISDTGIGIHQEKIQDLFQPFLQTSEYAINNEPGTGLGLTISKNIIERLNGTLGVCTQFNTGSTFWFNIPVSISKDKPSATQQHSILVIDPCKLRRNAFIKQLIHLGYTTQSISALTELKSQPDHSYDLVFFAEENKSYDVKKIHTKLKYPESNRVIFLLFHNHPSSSINFLTLPCRSSYLKNLISTITQSKQNISTTSHRASFKRVNSFSIFIADDNEINRLLLKSQLDPYCKKITLADEGKSALAYLQNNKYDLILLDLQMPYYSGQDLIKRIRQPGSINNQSPIIAITAHAQSHQRNLLIDAGFDECLIKPIVLEQLIELLDLWLPQGFSYSNNDYDAISYIKIMLNKTSGNRKLANTLFNKLFSELLEQSQTMGAALKANDLVVAKNIIHKLHGSVSFCGFTDIQEFAKVMEVSLDSNDPQLINSNFLSLKKKIVSFLTLKNDILNQFVNT